MSDPECFIAFDHHIAASLADFAITLKNCPTKHVGTVQLSELCSMSEYANGVYLFFDDQSAPWYVGKATSRSFIERVPSHFVQREDAWFNTLPKRVKRVCGIDSYSDALQLALSLQIVLIGVRETGTALKLEGALRAYLRPKLNATKDCPYSGQELLSSFVAQQ